MVLELFDPILKLIPAIKKPTNPLSIREKLKWTLIILGIYFLMFSIPSFGSNTAALQQPTIQLISIIFAARIGTLITVGISPIVLSSIVLQLLQGSGAINIDMQDPEQKSRMQGIQKLAAIVIAVVEAFIFVSTGYVPILAPSLYLMVATQLAIGAVCVIFLDEAMAKYGITSGLNMFIAGGVAYSIVAGTINIIFVEAIASITAGGAAAIPNALLAFGPLFFAVIVFLVSIYAYDIKVELPLVFSQFRGVGGRLPIPLLYTSVLPVILATSFELSMTCMVQVPGRNHWTVCQPRQVRRILRRLRISSPACRRGTLSHLPIFPSSLRSSLRNRGLQRLFLLSCITHNSALLTFWWHTSGS